MCERITVIVAAFCLDLLFGDPVWLYHPVRGIGQLVKYSERLLCRWFRLCDKREADRIRKYVAGVVMVITVLVVSGGITAALLYLTGMIHPLLKIVAEAVICYQMLAVKSLRTESMKVYYALKNGTVEDARYAVSMIVGRDTKQLTEEEITKAAVETVAENTSDGVIAPLIYMLLFGAMGGVIYKAINTMDSMVGYKNDRYIYLGAAAARLDDLANFIPSRAAALMMIAAAFFGEFDVKNAWRIYLRDRKKHASPNSAQTEAVCAGALTVQLAGDAYYFGKLYHKQTIGDALRKIESEDIRRANRLMYITSFVALIAGITVIFILQL